jgi:hypothetical protein
VSIIGIVSIGVMQADIDAEAGLVILWVPPTGVNDLICICRGIHRSVGYSIVYAVVTVIIQPGTQAIRPIGSRSRIANARLWRRCAARRRGRTIFARLIACEANNAVIKRIVGA